MKKIFFCLFLIFINSLFLFSKETIERDLSYNPNFSSSKFNNWLLVAAFNGDNVPTLQFIEKTEDKYWQINNEDTKEYMYKGKNSKAGMFFISSMTYYQYRGYNPLYTEKRNRDNADMMKRFYFYRFTGKGGGIISLDNTLIAIDIYTKYVYIYGVPVEEDKVFGVDVPQKWGPSDTVKYKGSILPFYKYDPVGHVQEDGTIVLYDFYLNSFLDKENRYQPLYNSKYIYK
ncbi:hypothetical protein JQ824_10425 [Brachyspira hyodysenteriae]|uniref:Uncharacterized protein n=2 Tax=Brachyspira hyodysenteriae TaxID=159 RepID=A0A3B6VFA9_BRAHW|nr:hypothetical protein [Brachyspira hyodysenteriae]ACN83564.1 hypothetical protein BHWA1_01081 [Brachyspira hyodysenteriae WA1]ANN64308.1 hypothetical protein BHYOB78_10645 [Brachyspira hyodysenteriae ATCC 27164]AUJ49298.1 hypothetical protein BH718_00848 [Brachyspira hyodysenteriae]KLI18096.1 hypothetical protein SU45_03700 [Brachyspira hyodysenteriae]KLI18532.1 hypothetical protein SU44_02165 [Brachyspira hyodysenteriae]